MFGIGQICRRHDVGGPTQDGLFPGPCDEAIDGGVVRRVGRHVDRAKLEQGGRDRDANKKGAECAEQDLFHGNNRNEAGVDSEVNGLTGN